MVTFLLAALFVVVMIYSYFGWTGVILAAIALIALVALSIKSAEEQAEIQEQERKKAEKQKFFITQLNNTHRIFSDCYHLIMTTTNIDTFCTRYELLLEKADELQKTITELSVYNELRQTIQKELTELSKVLPDAKERFILESCKKVIADSAELKTQKGRLNKLQKYADMLTEHATFFKDTVAFASASTEIQAQIASITTDTFVPHHEKGDPYDYSEPVPLSTDEEFERLRPLLDQEAMQRSADFAARHEKQVGTINIPALENACQLKPQPLKPSETLFLSYMDGYRDGNNIAGYWTHDYHIDYQATLEKFFSYDYMTFDDIHTQLSKYKIADFKDFLSSKEFKTTGKKDELITRIMENFDTATINDAFPRKILKLTEAGKAAIEAENYVLYFHQNISSFSIPLQLAENARIENPQLDTFSLALQMLTDRAENNLKNKDYGLYRNDLLAQATVHRDAGDYNTELELLFQVCFIDYYGYGNSGTQSKADSFFAPAVIWRVKHNPIYETLGDNAEEFYFQSVRKLPADFTQKSKPHFSFVKTAEAVADYKEYNER